MGADNTFGETNFNPDKPTKKVQWSGYGELGNISQKPPSPSSATAEEILQKYMDMSMIICPLHVVPRTVALDAMHEFAALQNKPQPTAEGAEEISNAILAAAHDYDTKIRNHEEETADSDDYIAFVNGAQWMREFAAQQQPTAEGAEEIIESILESLGDPINIHNHAFEIRPYTVDHKTEWWIFHKEVASGEPLAQWLDKFATLHAQQLAEKIVEEKYADTEADGYVFCGKCGKMKEI